MNQREGKVRVATLILSAFLVAVVLFLLIWVYGFVTGEEFSPQKFTMRRFHYWQVPMVRAQVWPVMLTKVGGEEDELAKHIRVHKLQGDVSLQPARWDIVAMDEVGKPAFRGDASILTSYLKQPGAAGLESWLDWTKAHPKLADEFWLVVARLAHEHAYTAIPALMEQARTLATAGFREEIRKIAAAECRSLAIAEKESGDDVRAAGLLQLAADLESS